jgi:EmrB/QacA subfamily drug resistance transporter
MTRSARWTLVATIIGSSMTFIDATVVNVALPALQADLHATITDVQWIIEAYALFLGGLILVGGSLGDQFGRKRVFLAGIALFTVASIACGLSSSVRTLVAARALQGVGAAFLVPGSLAIISATFEGAARGRAIGTWSGFSAITTAMGPVAGGWLIERVSWRAVFFLNVPLAAAVMVLSARFMTESKDESRTSRIDWVGAALAVMGLGGLVFGLLEWPRLEGNRFVLVVMAASLVMLVVLVFVERAAAEPMVPMGLFRSRTFSLTNILTLLLYAALMTVFWLVPLDLIQVQHYTATAAGAALLPFPILMLLLSRWSGGLSERIGSRLPLTTGSIVAAGGLWLYARAGIGGSYWTTFFPAVTVLGLGMGIVVAPLTTTVMASVDPHHAGVASGVNNAVARVAGLVAIALFGLILVGRFDAHVQTALAPVPLSSSAREGLDLELAKLAGADVAAAVAPPQRAEVRQAIDDAFVAAFDAVMEAAALVALTAAGVGAFIPKGAAA